MRYRFQKPGNVRAGRTGIGMTVSPILLHVNLDLCRIARTQYYRVSSNSRQDLHRGAMSPALETAESQWLAQLSTMRAAIADLDLLKDTQDNKPYGHDFCIDDEDLISSASTTGDDNLWDLIDSDRVADASDAESPSVNGLPTNEVDGETAFNTEWLQNQCARVAAETSGLDAHILKAQLLEILRAEDDELQTRLVDILGFDELDLVSALVSHRDSILALISSQVHDQLPATLLTRHEREEALRRQDYEHKTAVLQPSISRSSPQYPHIYGAKTAGNVLSAFGQKYSLPVGSEREDHEKYEEFSVPASRVGTLAAGERLVQIQDMDELCKGTFKGYKALNRMQSLVYPVAYKTSENMLICAPTGAVSAIISHIQDKT